VAEAAGVWKSAVIPRQFESSLESLAIQILLPLKTIQSSLANIARITAYAYQWPATHIGHLGMSSSQLNKLIGLNCSSLLLMLLLWKWDMCIGVLLIETVSASPAELVASESDPGTGPAFVESPPLISEEFHFIKHEKERTGNPFRRVICQRFN
jgi:hypothetical protein